MFVILFKREATVQSTLSRIETWTIKSKVTHSVPNLYFLSKNSTMIENCRFFFGVKNSWKCCGFGLLSCWQLWFHEKNCQRELGEKTRENVGVLSKLNFWTKFDFSNSVSHEVMKKTGFWSFWPLGKNMSTAILCLLTFGFWQILLMDSTWIESRSMQWFGNQIRCHIMHLQAFRTSDWF